MEEEAIGWDGEAMRREGGAIGCAGEAMGCEGDAMGWEGVAMGWRETRLGGRVTRWGGRVTRWGGRWGDRVRTRRDARITRIGAMRKVPEQEGSHKRWGGRRAWSWESRVRGAREEMVRAEREGGMGIVRDGESRMGDGSGEHW